MSFEAIEGEKIWQKNNCISCHQLYGLGGYLGPDLTNVASQPNKGEPYIKAFFNSAPGTMPRFHFTEKEKDRLYKFLKHVDQTGYYPVKNIPVNSLGWGNLKYK